MNHWMFVIQSISISSCKKTFEQMRQSSTSQVFFPNLNVFGSIIFLPLFSITAYCLPLPRYIIFHTLHLYWSSSTLRLLGVSVNFHKYTKLFLYNIVFISTFHMLTCCFISIHPLMLFVAWELSNCYEVKDTKKQSNWEPLPFLNSVTKRICIPRPGNNIILVISHNTIRIYDTRFRPLQIFKQLLYRSCSSIRY